MRPYPSPNKRRKRAYNETDDASNRTILVTQISQTMKVSSVAHYFENFGQIESIQLCLEQRFRDAVVQFTSSESARNVLHKRYHKIEKHVVAVYPADGQTKSNVDKIPVLNDKCLMKIFDHLEEFELCAVANTSTRFKRLAERTFSESKKFDQIELDQRHYNYSANKLLFETFNHLVKDLRVVAEVNEDDNLTEKFTEYRCIELKSLELRLHGGEHCITLDDDTKRKLKLIFSRLEHLNFVNNNVLDSKTMKELLSSCWGLKSIEVDSVGVCEDVHFPKLKNLVMHECSEAALQNVLSLNRGIKKLRIYCADEFTWNISAVIARYLPHLEKLSFGLSSFKKDADFNELGKLIHLKKIDITDRTVPVFDAIYDAAIPIESLELAIADETISRKVLTMKSIKKLLLERCDNHAQNIDDAYMLTLSKNLPLLRKLTLYNIDVITISGLERMLQRAKNLVSLELCRSKNVKKTDQQRLKMFIEKNCVGRDIMIEIDDYY